MRLDRFLAAATGCSRAQAAQWVRAGRVRVGESIAREPSRHVTDGEGVWLDEAPLRVEGPRYFLLHKPAGYVCSHRDEGGHLSALRLLDVPRREDLHFAGRLDADTTGLVLLTDDGAWSHRISAPRLCEGLPRRAGRASGCRGGNGAGRGADVAWRNPPDPPRAP